MKRTTLFSVGSALVAFGVISMAGYGCGDDDDNPVTPPKPDAPVTPETGGQDTSMPDTGPPAPPPVPTLGAQIDRMGRPAVSTALQSVFDPNDTTKGASKNAYNSDTSATTWATTYGPGFGGNLAIYDGLDETCGNQLLASQDAGSTTNALKYGTLAGILADDRLWLNTAGTSATQYLAVEANAVGVTNTDQGGRTLPMDVIDYTYSAVATGKLLTADLDVRDDIAADTAKTNGTTFPYLTAP